MGQSWDSIVTRNLGTWRVVKWLFVRPILARTRAQSCQAVSLRGHLCSEAFSAEKTSEIDTNIRIQV
jgi:hypothetical protein